MRIEYISQEVLTGRVLGNLELSNVRFTSALNDFGTWDARARALNTDADPLDLTEPWKCRIFMLVDGIPVECFDIWKRNRYLGSDVIEISGRTTGSILERWTIGGRDSRNFNFQNVEQRQIAKSLVQGALAEWGNAGISVPEPDSTNTRYRDKTTWDAVDAKPYGEALRDLADLSNGFQFRFEPYESGGSYGVRMITGAPYITKRPPLYLEGGLDPNGNLVGNILSLGIEESVDTLATDVTVWGSGEGASKLRGKADNPALAGGIPRAGRTENRSDVITQAWLNDRAATLRDASSTAWYPPTVAIRLDDEAHPFGSYQVGDEAYIAVDPMPVFPYGVYGKYRLLEVQVSLGADGLNVAALTIGDVDA